MTDLAAEPVSAPTPGPTPGKEEKLYTARPWQLIWWRFARH